MVFSGNGLVILAPIFLAICTLAWLFFGSNEKLKIYLCVLNLLLVALVFLQVFFKVIPVTGTPLVFSLLAVSLSMVISPIGIVIYGKFKNT